MTKDYFDQPKVSACPHGLSYTVQCSGTLQTFHKIFTSQFKIQF